MYVLTWAEMFLGVSLLLTLGALSVLEDLLEYSLRTAASDPMRATRSL
jgi:hypothetical protein